jgi:hypothetical protein
MEIADPCVHKHVDAGTGGTIYFEVTDLGSAAAPSFTADFTFKHNGAVTRLTRKTSDIRKETFEKLLADRRAGPRAPGR